MPSKVVDDCREPAWCRLFDWLGYLIRIASRNRRAIVSLLFLLLVIGIALVLPEGKLREDLKLNPFTASLISLVLLLINAPNAPEMLAEATRYLLRGGDAPNGALKRQVNESVRRHVDLMRVVEEIRSATPEMVLAEREKDETEVVRRSLKLADSVIRERLRLHEDDDVHVTLYVWQEGSPSLKFYESEEHSQRGFYNVAPVHDQLVGRKSCEAVSLFSEKYTFRRWANLSSRRHVKALALPPEHKACGCRSALVVDIYSGPLKAAVLFESRRPYEFGSRRRTTKIVKELIPFFITVRLALQYRMPKEATARRKRHVSLPQTAVDAAGHPA